QVRSARRRPRLPKMDPPPPPPRAPPPHIPLPRRAPARGHGRWCRRGGEGTGVEFAGGGLPRHCPASSLPSYARSTVRLLHVPLQSTPGHACAYATPASSRLSKAQGTYIKSTPATDIQNFPGTPTLTLASPLVPPSPYPACTTPPRESAHQDI
ncbi:hypothetical protein C8J57DRAFT_1379129, partial [Mycena rebaudengoi]